MCVRLEAIMLGFFARFFVIICDHNRPWKCKQPDPASPTTPTEVYRRFRFSAQSALHIPLVPGTSPPLFIPGVRYCTRIDFSHRCFPPHVECFGTHHFLATGGVFNEVGAERFHTLVQIRSEQIRSDQSRSDQIRSDQIRSDPSSMI